LVYGAVAAGGIGEDNSSNAFWLNQAYIDYMVGGVTIKAGKFGTHIGYETANQAENINITRAFSYNLLQPFSQIGARASINVVGLDVMFGVTNGYGEGQPEYTNTFTATSETCGVVDNGDGTLTADLTSCTETGIFDRGGNNKDIVWSLGWSNDNLGASFNGEWGNRPGTGDNSQLTLNGVLTFDPSDSITTWADITWLRAEEDGSDTEAVAIALGGRFALNDKMGVASRFEWGNFDGGIITATDADVWAITGTFDYLLAQGLTLKAEVAYTQVSADGPGIFSAIFPDGRNALSDDQVLLGLQLVYAF